ncbi:MAG: glycosyltransferase family 39 protein, partial [Bryobacterales bacterium]|nr:glycosyltransferase family 39 protein [Bryobacterales bacterium]
MRDTLAVVLFVLLLRVPFLNVAIQGDDVNYLGAAQYAQINPVHPTHHRFVFQGDWVSMRGHPHPPLNGWFQAALLALTGDIREPVYHGAYILFSLIAALSALAIARRFTAHPLLATLLTLSVPAYVIQGTSLESDLPFLAFWLLSIALFVSERLLLASVAMVFAAMSAFQAVLLVPVLGAWLWFHRRGWRAGWLTLLVVPVALGGWQLFERLTGEALPAQQLLTYFRQYGLQTLANKARNAAGLSVHLVWMMFPATLLLAVRWRKWR